MATDTLVMDQWAADIVAAATVEVDTAEVATMVADMAAAAVAAADTLVMDQLEAATVVAATVEVDTAEVDMVVAATVEVAIAVAAIAVADTAAAAKVNTERVLVVLRNPHLHRFKMVEAVGMAE